MSPSREPKVRVKEHSTARSTASSGRNRHGRASSTTGRHARVATGRGRPWSSWSPSRRLRLARALLVAGAGLVAVVLFVGLVRGLRATPSIGAAVTTPPARTTTAAAASATSPTSEDPNDYEGSNGHVGPTSTAVPTAGAGTFTAVDIPGAPSTATGRTVRVSLEVEDGITVDRQLVARTVRDVLLDARGWQAQDGVRFVTVSAKDLEAGARSDVRVTLATPVTVDRLCAPLKTQGKVSCANNGRAVLNLMRWETGAAAYGTDVGQYRIYQINHEVGHVIGHGHSPCPAPNAAAPVMLQQTLGLNGCRANPWPTVTKG